MKLSLLLASCVLIVLSGCVTPPPHSSPIAASAASYVDSQEPLTGSLFPSDQAVLSDDAVARILSSRLELPAMTKVALMRFPDGQSNRRWGRYYWQDEEYLKVQQSQVDALIHALQASGQVSESTPLPSLMTPTRVSIPLLREAAVRMQADLLLVYRINSDTYYKYRMFAKDQVKAYSTCELVLLDVRTGLVPFTKIITREQLEMKSKQDLDVSETMRRAEQTSATEALRTAAEDLSAFLKSTPKKAQ